ncbi:LOW QUALITY PROTEIN: hypothetical protein YC2023_091605 [Brassica napus]
MATSGTRVCRWGRLRGGRKLGFVLWLLPAVPWRWRGKRCGSAIILISRLLRSPLGASVFPNLGFWLEGVSAWSSGEVCTPRICGGGVALRPLCGFVPFGLGVQISVLGSSAVSSWLCPSEILRLVLSCGHGWEACSLGVVNRVGFFFCGSLCRAQGGIRVIVGLVLLRSCSERWQLACHLFP